MQGSAAPARPSRPCAQAFRRSSPPAGTQSISLLPHFSHRLATVAGMAKALKIATIHEHCPVSAVRLDVIHFRGRCPVSVPSTLPAKRLSQELSGAQIVCPFRRGVHPAPGSGRLAAACSVFGLMRCAVSARHQGAASWVSARPQGLLCHRAITSGQNKRAWADTSALRIMWLRLIGSGSNRCSKIAPACNGGNRHRPELCRPVGAGGASSSRTQGR